MEKIQMTKSLIEQELEELPLKDIAKARKQIREGKYFTKEEVFRKMKGKSSGG